MHAPVLEVFAFPNSGSPTVAIAVMAGVAGACNLSDCGMPCLKIGLNAHETPSGRLIARSCS
ncbi:MAG: hypothetical protein Kow0040_26780 [Thermogutta sp.]